MRRFGKTVVAIVLASVTIGVSGDPAGAQLTSNTFAGTGQLSAGGHRATVTVQLACTPDGSVQFTVALQQGDTVGIGRGAAVCTGALEEYVVTVTARSDVFEAGAASVCGNAINRERGGSTDTRQWCRAAPVTLA